MNQSSDDGRAQRERAASVAHAISTADAELRRLGARVAMEHEHPTPYNVSFATVYDEDDGYVCIASGKGFGEQGRASLLFEGIEHFQLAAAARVAREAGQGRVLTPPELLAQPALRGEMHLNRLASDYPTAAIGCLPYESLDGADTVWFPAIWKNPSFEFSGLEGDDPDTYRAYLRYGSNNGSASGISASEAVLHGLLEQIERDAISMALIDWFIGEEPARPRIIDLATLPRDLRVIATCIEEKLGAPPLLCDLTTDIGVPVLMALPSGPDRIALYGGGASLSVEYAAERALGELLQSLLIAEWKELAPSRVDRLSVFEPWPRLRRMYQLDLDVLPSSATVTDFRALAGAPIDLGIDDQVDAVVAALGRAGFRVFHRTWSEPTAEVSVKSVLVPGLESFSCFVMAGAPALPTGRGIERARLGALPR